jgi:uncharacterized protein (TIGR02757 family)
VGLIASSLAYGRVSQILNSVRTVLDAIGPSPSAAITGPSSGQVKKKLRGFKHRFTTGEDVAALLAGAAGAIEEHGSLNACFADCVDPADADVVAGLQRFTERITGHAGCACDFLLPQTAKGSACKRLNLYLRWMIRQDAVDPGGWTGISPAMLVVPLDTHMFRAGTALGFTSRRQPGLKAALEITRGFAGIAPEDPVRYDFALTRLGIRNETTLDEFLDAIDR